MATWALLGATVDLWRPRPWREPPVEWSVLVPYLAIYFSAQMFLWWPLWNFAREIWLVFLGLFVAKHRAEHRGHTHTGARMV